MSRWPKKYHVPIVVTGFEPLDVLEGIRRAVRQLEAGRGEVENAYAPGSPARRQSGRPEDAARGVCGFARKWRGIGEIPYSGWELSDIYNEFDATKRFTLSDIRTQESPLCRSGEVLQG